MADQTESIDDAAPETDHEWSCAVCEEESTAEEPRVPALIQGPDHYCARCTLRAFEYAIESEANYPPRIAGQRLYFADFLENFDSLEDVDIAELRRAYELSVSTWTTPINLRLFCRRCERFIGRIVAAPSVQDWTRVCPQCEQSVCGRCGRPVGDNPECPNCEGGRDLKDQDIPGERGRDFQRCPDCQRPAELGDGCNHVGCPCGTQFCFICGEGATGNSGHWDRGQPCPRYHHPNPRIGENRPLWTGDEDGDDSDENENWSDYTNFNDDETMEEADANRGNTTWRELIPRMEDTRRAGSNRLRHAGILTEHIARMMQNGLFQNASDWSRVNIARRIRFAHFAALLSRHHRLASRSRRARNRFPHTLAAIRSTSAALRRLRRPPYAMGIDHWQTERDVNVIEAVTENVLGRLNHDQISQSPGSDAALTDEERTDYRMVSLTARIFGLLRDLFPILRSTRQETFDFPDSVRVRAAWVSLFDLWPYHGDHVGGQNFRNYGDDQRAAYELVHFILYDLVVGVAEEDTSEWELFEIDWNDHLLWLGNIIEVLEETRIDIESQGSAIEDLLPLVDALQRALRAIRPVAARIAAGEGDVTDAMNDINWALDLILPLRHHADRDTESFQIVIDRARQILRRLQSFARSGTP